MKLVVFDADGTLVSRDTGELLPGVREYLDIINHPGCCNRPAIAIATNQGGPACGEQPWAKPGQFPTLAQVEARYGALAERVGARLYMSLAYVTKHGEILLPRAVAPDDPRARLDWRKPAPGMLLQAMADANAMPAETLVIGDSPEDRAAAEAAGCAFQWAQKFFSRGWEPGRDYGLIGGRR